MSYQYSQAPMIGNHEMPTSMSLQGNHSPTRSHPTVLGKSKGLSPNRNISPFGIVNDAQELDISPLQQQYKMYGDSQSYNRPQYSTDMRPPSNQQPFGYPQYNGVNSGFDTSPVDNQAILALGSYNRSSLGGYSQSTNSSPLLNPIPVSVTDFGSNGAHSMGLNSGYPSGNSQPYQMYPPLRDSRNQLDDLQMQEMPPSIEAYLQRQNQLMARILKDVEDYKKMEYTRQLSILDQQPARSDPYGSQMGRPDPYGSPMMRPDLYGPSVRPDLMQNGRMDRYASPLGRLEHTNPLYQLPPGFRSPTPELKRPVRQVSQLPSMPPKFNAGAYFGDPDLDLVANRNSFPNSPQRNKSPTKLKETKEERQKKKRIAKKMSKTRGRRLLRVFGWAIAVPGMWFLSAAKWEEKRRKKELKALEDAIPRCLEKFLEFGAVALAKEIRNFSMDKNSMIIVLPPGAAPLKPLDLDKRCKTITDHLCLILDHLSLQIESGKLPKTFFKFLGQLSEDDGVVPEDFLSGFEMDRLAFNIYGNLNEIIVSRNMNEWKSKMLLATFILIKGLLHFLMLKPWMAIPSIKEKNVNIKNMFNAGSVFYHIILDLLRERVPREQHVITEPPFKAKPPTMAALDPDHLSKLDVLPEDNHNDAQEVISNFYSRARLNDFLRDRPALVKEVKDAINDFMDVLYHLTHSSIERKWHVKEAFKDYRPSSS